MPSESARATKAAVVEWLAARFDVAGLLTLEELDEFRDGLAYPRELLLTRVLRRGHVSAAQPHGARRLLRGRRGVLCRRRGGSLLADARLSRRCAVVFARRLRFDVVEASSNLREARAERWEVVARGTRAARRLVREPARDALRQFAHPVLLAAHPYVFASSSSRSTRSTTPTMAESIAAPCSPVAVVEALQPS